VGPKSASGREQFWEDRIANASTPRKKVYALQSKMLADIERLPPHLQDEARAVAVAHLSDALDEIQIKLAEEVWV